MSESVKILIEAEDLASAKIALAARAIETNIKSVKDVGKNAKSSTEFFGTLANALGGSEIASYASQLGQVSEKVSQFSEVQKLGGVGAMAFKAGLVAVVGVLAFQVGNAIGNVIFQTEKWTKKLAEANAEAKKLAAQAAKIQGVQFAERKEDVELIRDPADKQAAYSAMLVDLNKNLAGVELAVRRGKKEVEEWDAAWLKTGNRAAFAEQAKNKLEEDKQRLSVLQDQRLEIEKVLGPRAAENALIREQNALKAKSDSYLEGLRAEVELLRAKKDEVAGITAAKNTTGDAATTEATALLREKDQINAANASKEYVKSLKEQLDLLEATNEERSAVEASQKAVGSDITEAAAILDKIQRIKDLKEAEKEAEDERKKIQADQESAAKRIADLKKNELEKLEEERILLTQGKEAAHIFNLEKQGLSKTDATMIARQQTLNDFLRPKDKKSSGGGDNNLQAFESRLLTRGTASTVDPAITVAQNTQKLVEQNAVMKMQFEQMKEALERISYNTNYEYEEVS